MNTYHVAYENGTIEQFQSSATDIDGAASAFGYTTAAEFLAVHKGQIVAGPAPDSAGTTG